MKKIFLFFVLWVPIAFAQAEILAEAKCPSIDLPPETRCYSGQDTNGAWYWIAIPKNWNSTLIIHNHGGPSLEPPQVNSSVSDLKRFAVVVKEGYAWAGSSYRHAGFGVRDAAEDTDNLRKIFWQHFGRPRYTFLHGQSWGASIAVKTAELYNPKQPEKLIYKGVALTNGVLGGATQSYDFRADLRAVYQYYCRNHPAINETQYPLWQGLAADSTMTTKELEARISQCTGVNLPANERSPLQRKNLRNILSVIKIPERSLQSHMAWATFTFHDLVMRQLGGKSPFSNTGVEYSGSDDNVALNKNIERFTADKEAVRQLSYDADFSGKLSVPTISIHAVNDPTAFVELENSFYQRVKNAGADGNLLQVFTNEDNHQRLSNSEYAAVFSVLQNWVSEKKKPVRENVYKKCDEKNRVYAEGCEFAAGYFPPELSSRVKVRAKPD